MNVFSVFIIGVRGFLGSNLAAALEARGHQVRGSSRAAIRIGDPVDPAVFEDADTVVHCAHDFQAGALERNVEGSRLLFDAARGRRRIFVSSHSAREDAIGEYGISKYRIERFYLAEGETVVRPGLVIGAGGSFWRRMNAMRSARIIPLADGGRDGVPVLAIADFREAMARLIESGQRGAWNLFNETMPTVREMTSTVLRLEGRRALLVPIPYGPALAAVRAAEMLNVPLPFDSASLRTLKLNRKPVHESDLRKLIERETGVAEAIAYALGVAPPDELAQAGWMRR